jgi:hypothetical protein
MRIVAAALLYFVIVFGAGFLLGPIRVFWLEPHVGATVAALCEAPFLLVVMVAASRWLPSMLQIEHGVPSLVLMGIGALALQQVADVAVGVGLRGIAFADQLAHFATAAGLIYAGLLLLFAAMPLLVNRCGGVR